MLLGHREFTDGQTRPVYLDDENRQYVESDDGWSVYGAWMPPNEYDAPTIVRAMDAEGSGQADPDSRHPS